MLKLRSIHYLCAIICACGCVTVAAQRVNGEYQPDKNTLFLAHYNNSLDADFAVGNPESSGNMSLVSGRFGQGAYAHAGLIEQTNLSKSPFFRMLRYSHQKNLDITEGTFEVWLKSGFSLAGALNEKNKFNDYYLFHLAISPGNKDIGLYIRERRDPKTEKLQYRLCWREMWERISNDIFTMECDVALESGQWYHLAVTWSPTQRSIYLDGKKVASKANKRTLPNFGPSARPMAIGSMATYSSRPTEAVIDEVRISNIVRYKNDFQVDK